MKARTARVLEFAVVIVLLLLLLWGCAPEASFAVTLPEDVPAFIADFGRQLLAALLL